MCKKKFRYNLLDLYYSTTIGNPLLADPAEWITTCCNVCLDALYTINSNEVSTAVHLKPIPHSERLPTPPRKQVWEAGGQESDREVLEKKNKDTKRS